MNLPTFSSYYHFRAERQVGNIFVNSAFMQFRSKKDFSIFFIFPY